MTFHQHKLSLVELLTVHASVYLEPRASLQDQVSVNMFTQKIPLL